MRRSSDIRTGLSVREVDVVVTPRVREEVQRHFGCDKVGLQLTSSRMKIGSLCDQILFIDHWTNEQFVCLFPEWMSNYKRKLF